MRTVAQIKIELTQNWMANTTVIAAYNLDGAKTFEQQFSNVSLESILFDAVAYCTYVLEFLFASHEAEVKEIISSTKPGNVRWYRAKTLDFQFGHELAYGGIVYDNTGISEEDVEVSKVVKQCSVSGRLRGVRVKVAGQDGAGELTPLTGLQEAALLVYLEQVRYAGVRVYITNAIADKLLLNLKIYYDPLVLGADGKRLDGTEDTPVVVAIDSFLRNLPFDGLFTAMQLVDALQSVKGVVMPHVVEMAAKYGALAYVFFDISYLPDAGYMRLEDLTVEYLPHNTL